MIKKFWNGFKKICRNVADSFTAISIPQIYHADRMAETQMISTATQIDLQDRREEFRKNELLLQEMQRLDNLAFQTEERSKDRNLQRESAARNHDLQRELAQYNQQLQTHQGELNRELQRDLTTLNHEFQANQGQLNRTHATKLEQFRATMQQWAVEKQIDIQLKRMAFDEREQAKNRELQRELAEWNQQFQAHQGQLSRELQRELTALNHEFQAHQGQLSREHATLLENFRAAVQMWALDQQRELQLKLKQMDAELALELRQIDRESALVQLRESKKLQHLPIGLLGEQILMSDNEYPLPLRVLFSPPNPRYGESQNPTHVVTHFPRLEDALSEQSLARGIRDFLEQYALDDRPIEFIGGAWKDKSTQIITHEAAARAVFTELKTEPFLILDSEIVSYNFDLHFAFWSSYWTKPRYKSITAFSWREALYDSARSRALQWQAQTSGKTKEQIINLYGESMAKQNLANLKVWQREEQAVAEGIDTEHIERSYYLHETDYGTLTELIIFHHCLVAGLLADEYFLLHVPIEFRQRPLLPKLISDSLQGAPIETQQDIIEIIIDYYQAMCDALAQEESTWMPELKLEIAWSLVEFSDKSWAKQLVAESMQVWLDLRGIKPARPLNGEWISLDMFIEEISGRAMSMADQDYLAKLDECWSAAFHPTRPKE